MSRGATTWSSLNERQKRYMLEVFRMDQIHERYQKQTYNSSNHNHTPAREWRRLEYADTYTGYTPLKQAIIDADLVDQGTGSTFKALADRGLIEVEGNFRSGLVYVWLTAQGRKLVRDSQGVQAPKALKTGQLREWHWRALVLAYGAGEEGVQEAGLGYGRIGWNTWLRLRDYKINGVEYPLAVQRNGMSITSFGKAFYYLESIALSQCLIVDHNAKMDAWLGRGEVYSELSEGIPQEDEC